MAEDYHSAVVTGADSHIERQRGRASDIVSVASRLVRRPRPTKAAFFDFAVVNSALVNKELTRKTHGYHVSGYQAGYHRNVWYPKQWYTSLVTTQSNHLAWLPGLAVHKLSGAGTQLGTHSWYAPPRGRRRGACQYTQDTPRLRFFLGVGPLRVIRAPALSYVRAIASGSGSASCSVCAPRQHRAGASPAPGNSRHLNTGEPGN
jgi:hypothetical protein